MNVTESLIATLQKRVASLPDPEPAFEIKVGWANDYDEVFSEGFEVTQNANSLLDRALEGGRVLLTGRGGGAKTVILTRIAKAALAREVVCIFIPLKEWTTADYQKWRGIKGALNRISYLLQRFAGLDIMPRDIGTLDPSLLRLIIVDGLNEVDRPTGQQIVNALDEYARFAISTSVLVSDRLVRRDFVRPDRWRLAVALPLSPTEIRAQISKYPKAFEQFKNATPDQLDLLSTPYFLNALIQGGDLAYSTSNEMAEYFQRHALAPNQIDVVAEAAYQLYAGATRTFEWSKFSAMVGDDVSQRLLAAGAVVITEESAFFDHHLKHDYLVARHLAHNSKLWTSSVFSAVTFHASSFETIRMAMEQIEDAGAADELLRHLYDWNIYGAGYSIAEGRASHVSEDMQVIILAMFAERRWDRVIATAQRAHDTLRLIRVDRASRFLTAATLDDVFRLIENIDIRTKRFIEWRALFTLPTNAVATDHQINGLADVDSVIGWTSANVLKRLDCSPEQQRRLRDVLQDHNVTVQWRAAHVLGSFPSNDNYQSLVSLLGSQASDVRFGAVRSLIEMASRSTVELSKAIFEALSQQVDQIRTHSSVLAEFERALFIRSELAPPNWTRLASITILALQKTSPDIEDRERWDLTLSKMMDTYGI